MTSSISPLLLSIHSPEDLRLLQRGELYRVADELRSFILDVVSANPGHLGASLGVIELTVALHYLFNTPVDKLVWDVGHQAYAHKILTGRRKHFDSLRKWGGISGFPVMTESDYDAFGTGHASTALSSVLGMAIAAGLQGMKKLQHIAVVGDGAISGGMFFEALNHTGHSNVNLLIILNDNGISIDKSSGALKDYLIRLREQDEIPSTSNPLFESFGVKCFGPVDGNNLTELLPALEKVKAVDGVRLLHVLTTKGKGFERAEKEQVLFHAPGTFDRLTGDRPKLKSRFIEPPLYQHVFGATLVELAELNSKIVAITPAMPSGSSVNLIMERFPDRAFDVDIAEQHAVTFAAGLATQGFLPYCVIYSTFLQRAYDQIIHDVALQNIPIVLCIDRAGLVGEDGATHHGVFDLAYLRCIPNLTISAPMNEEELRNLMFSAQQNPEGPFVIRYPRGRGILPDWKRPFQSIEKATGRCLRKGNKIAVISLGHPGNFVINALDKLDSEGIHLGHFDLRFLKPLDEHLLEEVFNHYPIIITVEDGVINGGMGSALMEWAQDNDFFNKIVRLGVPDRFIFHGEPARLQQECGFDASDIEKTIRTLL
ncbi:MAG: 1-deoxy-D-xylulose-5-phosphate synthase [Bacteroidetes bacterium HGW-Bacteroidetes-1]|jgi:1-deoxy-D-xylulose-5-phosphate synthase|nr:MAG: 1-deoxy-D-xylulose-5-phosphate synthase [Bacteroidetes bacterium HGW-Bacteroidetes-1]